MFNNTVYLLIMTGIALINARRACARGLQYFTLCVCVCVCLCVCSKFAASKSSLYDKMDLPACFSPVFLDFQFIDLSKMPSFPRKSAFHSLSPVGTLCHLQSLSVTCSHSLSPVGTVGHL